MSRALLLPLCALALAATAWAAPATVGLVTDIGGIDDKSFNQGTWEGVKAYGKENGLKEGKGYKYLQSTAEADYVPNLSTFSDEKLDLIVAPGFLFNSAMLEVATQYPHQHYLIIDSVVKTKDGKLVTNVANAVFAEHEGSFLVGVAAGLKCKAEHKDKVGFVNYAGVHPFFHNLLVF